MFSSSSFTTSSPPFLPPELIDEILRDSDLSTSDLARCCLVSRQFLPFARQSLYYTLEVIFLGVYINDYGTGPQGWSWCHFLSSARLCRTLLFHSNLLRLCTGLKLTLRESDTEDFDWSHDRVTPLEFTRAWLDLMPRVQNLSLDWWSAAIFRVDDSSVQDRSWTTVELPLDDEYSALPRSLRASGVKRLKVWQDSPYFTWKSAVLYVPSTVTTLDAGDRSTFDLRLRRGPQLRNLRLAGPPVEATRLSQFPSLQYLSINGFRDYGVVDSQGLWGMACLRRLSLTFEDYYANEEYLMYSDTIQSLLSHLPPSLSRLDFRDAVPFDILTSILRFVDDLPITELGVSEKVNSDPDKTLEMDSLRTLCEMRGIEIYHLGEKDAIFDF